ncbi:carbohydrate ABC transporter substrate-binding protein [Phyllobacterium endophyticum]|uniref:Probable sugar-binding periplasmic protein n=3 Tax=Phyllobacterium endophyticum TaxID=1149773 RepID=A0A2P7ASV1_9HYPH|nr:sugar ABC transporter substrate-binding protein [Phyllobacterium endophyticum]TYR40474.1 carbohydrate ABC transporter substrate-binding protein [Phyllobacterium endophyticum]
MIMSIRNLIVATGLLLSTSSLALADEPNVEVMHYWTSGSEAAGLDVLKTLLEKEGVKWADSPVAGGTGMNMVQVLRARIASDTAPAAAQMHAQQVQAWAAEDVLADLSDVAQKDDWASVIAPELVPLITSNGKYVAVPVNVHRSNWLWYNKKVFDNAGLQPPTSWEEFNAVSDKLLAAGVTPLALGGQPWQELDLFESAVLGLGGPDFYRQAILQLDEKALQSDTMVKVFDQLRKMNKYVDSNYPGRDWNLATQMLIKGEAAMQIMGDWAKGELALANMQPNVDYGCVPAPGTKGSYVWLTDNFGFFVTKDPNKQAGQTAMASAILDKGFQEAFNLKKGSIPSRIDVSMDKFDFCGKAAYADRAEAQKSEKSLPSLAHNAAADATKTGVFLDVVSTFFETPSVTSKQAIDQLVAGLKSAQ